MEAIKIFYVFHFYVMSRYFEILRQLYASEKVSSEFHLQSHFKLYKNWLHKVHSSNSLKSPKWKWKYFWNREKKKKNTFRWLIPRWYWNIFEMPWHRTEFHARTTMDVDFTVRILQYCKRRRRADRCSGTYRCVLAWLVPSIWDKRPMNLATTLPYATVDHLVLFRG